MFYVYTVLVHRYGYLILQLMEQLMEQIIMKVIIILCMDIGQVIQLVQQILELIFGQLMEVAHYIVVHLLLHTLASAQLLQSQNQLLKSLNGFFCFL